MSSTSFVLYLICCSYKSLFRKLSRFSNYFRELVCLLGALHLLKFAIVTSDEYYVTRVQYISLTNSIVLSGIWNTSLFDKYCSFIPFSDLCNAVCTGILTASTYCLEHLGFWFVKRSESINEGECWKHFSS